MRKYIFKYLIFLCLAIMFFNCTENKAKNQKQDVTTRYKKEKKKITKAKKKKEIIDLDNKGIGPIKSVSFNTLDKNLVAEGSKIFKEKCTICHKTDKKFLGPAMKGIYKKRSPEWVMNMILNPIEMVEKDPIAKQQFVDYNNTLMINQNLTQQEARAIAEYLRTL